ncbi:MAG: carbohydrate kinase [Defluviitaleaceae bacterium]|nr:carbohydrate kinase [Defluviitaleaceae bacterium]
MYDITVLGELLIDFTYHSQSGHGSGGNALFEQNAGGAVANVAALCAGFGLKTAFLGKIGKDMHGDFLRGVLEGKGVDTSGLISDDKFFTTLAFVKLDGAERSFSFARKPGADTQISPGELKTDILKNTKIFHFGSLSLTDEPAREATHEAIKTSKAAGAICSYDPNYRASLWPNEEAAKIQMRSLIEFADVMKISDEEAELLTGYADSSAALSFLLDKGVKVAVLTRGEAGSMAAIKDGAVIASAAKCNPVDTTGAGDAFWGAFLYCLLKSKRKPEDVSLDELGNFLEFSNAAAALCVEGRGAIPALPSLDAVLDKLD